MLTLDINNPQQYCNLACEFCYSWNLEGMLSLADIKKTVQENQKHSQMEIGGGEPLLHPDIANIVLYLTINAGKYVHIATNGTYVPQPLLALPKESRDRTQIQVSLHASNAQLFGEITGKQNLFERVLHNIPIFTDYFMTSINTVVYSKNVDDIPSIVELVAQYDLPHRVMLAIPQGKGKNMTLVSAGQIADITGYLLAQRARGLKIESPLLQLNNCPAIARAYGIPQAGICPAQTGLKKYVHPYGTTRCEFLPPIQK